MLIPTKFEAAAFLKRLSGLKPYPLSGLKAWSGKLEGHDVIVALCGMGLVHAGKRSRLFLDAVQPERLILAGFAGGLDPSLKLGDAVRAEASELSKWVHTSSVVVPTAEAKHQLWEQTGCRVVEMEATAVTEVAVEKGVPLTVLRVVSDDCDEALPECLQYGYDMEKGKESPLRMAFYLATHPSEISTLKLFLKRTSPCSEYVARALVDEI